MKKEFKPFKSYTVRMSDEVWDKLKKAKLKSGKSWNKFLIERLELIQKI